MHFYRNQWTLLRWSHALVNIASLPPAVSTQDKGQRDTEHLCVSLQQSAQVSAFLLSTKPVHLKVVCAKLVRDVIPNSIYIYIFN